MPSVKRKKHPHVEYVADSAYHTGNDHECKKGNSGKIGNCCELTFKSPMVDILYTHDKGVYQHGGTQIKHKEYCLVSSTSPVSYPYAKTIP